ncbi:expressed conserved protein [Echinococcus multilocularis]|uniref:Expressed conserved protein n=1 Tax=Echinococcus multilocularis TaxID=6211 RepID=A0A068YE00_ECHMU|nr:expressed conserved protein [Echinococcus multilocularis]
MALDTKMSCLASVLTFIISISTLHLIKSLIVDMPLFYILIGIYGGILCVVLLTAINNLENLIFSNDFCAQFLSFYCGVIFLRRLNSSNLWNSLFFDIMCMLLLLESNISTNSPIPQYSGDRCCGKEKAELITIPQTQMFFSMDILSYVF